MKSFLLFLLLPFALVAEPKAVFAHYMVCIPTYGGNSSIADYQKEIQDAQAAGIDGFALNCGGWSLREPHYKKRTQMIYQAAQELGTGFKLIMSVDFASGLTDEEFVDIVETVRSHPNQFLYKGKPVLSTFGGSRHQTEVLRKAFGDSVVYLPFYYPMPAAEMPNKKQVDQVFDAHGKDLDGFFHFGAAGTWQQMVNSNRLLAEKWHSEGKLFMAGISPFYRGYRGNYRVFDYRGFEGVAAQWEGAIADNADFVEMVTWNDWGECSYFAPLPGQAPSCRLYNGNWGALTSHAAYLKASRYYIAWYKTGRKPTIAKDALFYFHRLNPKTVPANKNLKADQVELALPAHSGKLTDELFVTVFAKSAGTLTVFSGKTEKRFAVEAGINHVSLQFEAGEQRFLLERHGKTLIDKTGECAISADDPWSVFNMFSGDAVAK